MKKLADIIAHQVGIASITGLSGPVPPVVTSSPCYMYYAFSINALSLAIGSAYFPIDSVGVMSTNFKSVRPKSITVTIEPVNPQGKREGFMFAGMSPVTSVWDVEYWKKMKISNLVSPEETMGYFPIKRRARSDRPLSLRYDVPTSNTYLHMGQDFEQNMPVAVVLICFECHNRDSYLNFSSHDFDVDIKLTAVSEFLNRVPFGSLTVSGNYLTDLLAGQALHTAIQYKDKRAVAFFDATDFEFDSQLNAMAGPLKLLSGTPHDDSNVEASFEMLNM